MRLRESIPFPLETLGDSHVRLAEDGWEEAEGKGDKDHRKGFT